MRTRLFTLLIALLWAHPLLADSGDAATGGHMHGMGDGWSHSMFGPMAMILVVVLVVLVAVALFRAAPAAGQGSAPDPTTSALEILKMRFARGEIEPEEYEARRKVLDDN